MSRVTVELDNDLLKEAKRLSGARTARAAIELALRELIRRHKTAGLAKLGGRIGIKLSRRDLDAMRAGR